MIDALSNKSTLFSVKDLLILFKIISTLIPKTVINFFKQTKFLGIKILHMIS